jgi:hypothetical protein
VLKVMGKSNRAAREGDPPEREDCGNNSAHDDIVPNRMRAVK